MRRRTARDLKERAQPSKSRRLAFVYDWSNEEVVERHWLTFELHSGMVFHRKNT